MEEKLKESELNLNLALERNVVMERDLIKVNDDLNKSMKWTASFKLLGDMSSSWGPEKRGLGYVNKIDPPPIIPTSNMSLLLIIFCVCIMEEMVILKTSMKFLREL